MKTTLTKFVTNFLPPSEPFTFNWYDPLLEKRTTLHPLYGRAYHPIYRQAGLSTSPQEEIEQTILKDLKEDIEFLCEKLSQLSEHFSTKQYPHIKRLIEEANCRKNEVAMDKLCFTLEAIQCQFLIKMAHLGSESLILDLPKYKLTPTQHELCKNSRKQYALFRESIEPYIYPKPDPETGRISFDFNKFFEENVPEKVIRIKEIILDALDPLAFTDTEECREMTYAVKKYLNQWTNALVTQKPTQFKYHLPLSSTAMDFGCWIRCMIDENINSLENEAKMYYDLSSVSQKHLFGYAVNSLYPRYIQGNSNYGTINKVG